MNKNIYQKMYTLLFNRITDALNVIESENWDTAKEILISAQLATESLYVNTPEDPEQPEA